MTRKINLAVMALATGMAVADSDATLAAPREAGSGWLQVAAAVQTGGDDPTWGHDDGSVGRHRLSGSS